MEIKRSDSFSQNKKYKLRIDDKDINTLLQIHGKLYAENSLNYLDRYTDLEDFIKFLCDNYYLTDEEIELFEEVDVLDLNFVLTHLLCMTEFRFSLVDAGFDELDKFYDLRFKFPNKFYRPFSRYIESHQKILVVLLFYIAYEGMSNKSVKLNEIFYNYDELNELVNNLLSSIKKFNIDLGEIKIIQEISY